MTAPVKLTDDVLALLKLKVTYRDCGARERAILDAVRELRDAACELVSSTQGKAMILPIEAMQCIDRMQNVVPDQETEREVIHMSSRVYSTQSFCGVRFTADVRRSPKEEAVTCETCLGLFLAAKEALRGPAF